MPEATFRAPDGILPYTPGSAASAGEVIQLADGRAAVVQCALAASELGSVLTKGHFDFTAATGVTFVDGEAVVWDASANTAINAQSADLADFVIGNATKAKVSGELVVRVELNSHFAKERKIIATAAAITLTAADAGATVYGDTQAGAFSITLPTAASCKGERFTFIRAGTGTNALTLDGDASETVDGSTTVATMDAARDTLTIESNGSAWFIVAARLA
jgi:predicted RecA/RadA family phage recombinase